MISNLFNKQRAEMLLLVSKASTLAEYVDGMEQDLKQHIEISAKQYTLRQLDLRAQNGLGYLSSKNELPVEPETDPLNRAFCLPDKLWVPPQKKPVADLNQNLLYDRDLPEKQLKMLKHFVDQFNLEGLMEHFPD